MKTVRLLLFGLIAVAVSTAPFTVSTVSAAESGGLKAPDQNITIDGKKPARFNHPLHLDQGMACGQCHHDQEKQPLTEADIAALPDAGSLACVSCHNSDFAQSKLRKAKDVFHATCRACHKAGYNDKQGPSKCSACHIKTKRKAIEGC